MTIELIIDGRRYYVSDLTAERLFRAYYGQNHDSNFDYVDGWPSENSMNFRDRL